MDSSLYQSLLQAVDGVVWEADAQTFEFKYVSDSVYRILGYTQEEWLSSPTFWQDHIYHEDVEAAIRYCHVETTIYAKGVTMPRTFQCIIKIICFRYNNTRSGYKAMPLPSTLYTQLYHRYENTDGSCSKPYCIEGLRLSCSCKRILRRRMLCHSDDE